MREIVIDLARYGDRKTLHNALRDKFGFEEWYGANLDALHDMLTEFGRPTRVKLYIPDEPAEGMKAYIPKLRRVFLDAAEQNKYLTVEIARGEAAASVAEN